MTLSTTDDVWITSSAIDDVVCKECHGKQVLPLWSPRSKWPIQEIILISLTFCNFLPGSWPCGWHSCLIYLLCHPHVICLPSARTDDVIHTSSTHAWMTSSARSKLFSLIITWAPVISKWSSFESKSRDSSAKNQVVHGQKLKDLASVAHLVWCWTHKQVIIPGIRSSPTGGNFCLCS